MSAQDRPAHIAKISPPRLPRILRRERLFGELGEALRAPAVWVSGPAGSGKTTLVASFLEAQQLPVLWYQIDPQDADLATFFHYLGAAARRATPRKRGGLPHLTRGYLAGLEEFAQRFFEALCQRLDGPGVLVFDDCHRLPVEAPLYQVLGEVLARLPGGVSAVFISRGEPPAGWARLRANQALRVLGWEQLRLTREETLALSGLLAGRELPEDSLEALHAQVQGWVAGLVLLLEQAERLELPAALHDGADLSALFDYFAGEIFQRQSPPLQDFLLKTALLPRINVPVAERLTGNRQAGRILRDLARVNYFTTQHGSDEVFEYHPLFHDFLRHRLESALPPEALTALRRRAGELLVESGDPDAAAQLFIEGGAWSALAALVLQQARALFKQGRYRTLQDWLEALPADQLAADPWLPYWLGISIQPYHLKRSRGYLDQAYRAFKGAGDLAGTYLAWTAAVDSCLYVWGDFKDLDYWLDELRDLQEAQPGYPSQEVEARVSYCMLNAMMRRRPHDPQIHFWSDRAEAMLQEDISLTYRMMIGNTLLLYHMRWSGNVQRAEVVASIMRTLVVPGEGAPLAEITWWVMEAGQCWVMNDAVGCLRAVERGFALAKASGVHLLDFMLYILAICGSQAAGDLDSAEAYLARMPESLKTAINKDAASHYYLQMAVIALLRGQLPRAREHAEMVRLRILQSEAPLSVSLDATTTAQVLLETGAYHEAAQALQFARRWGRKVNNTFLEFHTLLCEAELALVQDDRDQALPPLREALALGRRQGYLTHPWLGPARPPITRLYLLALAEGIEVDYVQSLIRHQRLVPAEPPSATLQWPWPVQIQTLGRFVLSLDGEAIEGRRGSRGKPLELLQALIAYGGQGVSEAVLTDALWPDTDGDAGHHAFETTLYRLRKLIGSDQAVVLHNGQLSLDRRHCWVDVWALQEVTAGLQEALRRDGREADLRAGFQRLRQLYQGPFLHNAGDEAWAELLRERLDAQLDALLLRLAGAQEAQGAHQAAAEVYSWWLEIKPLAEENYRRLMLCYARLGQKAEARAVYDRCQRLLRKLRGLAPSAETQALHQSLLG